MTDAWDERRKALENEYFHKIENRLIEQMRKDSREKLARELSRNRCPKCGEQIQAIEFRGVPLDKCPGCGGVWLGPRDLQILSEKDHRTWFDRWFKEEK
ncbi:MAG: hypothetical protein FDZ69_10645 [Deltaproteobacteria bacterium]|nr:MAG: hypothetical protein FDZ69_10645 [Deltaproteobacteria bacterium]